MRFRTFPTGPLVCKIIGLLAAIAFTLRIENIKKTNRIRLTILTLLLPLSAEGEKTLANNETPAVCRNMRHGDRSERSRTNRGGAVEPRPPDESLWRPSQQRRLGGKCRGCPLGPGSREGVQRSTFPAGGVVHDGVCPERER